MAYPYVQAAADYGIRTGPVLAFVIHMAEGGGTVGFLSRDNARGVSVHYVIEYSGRIVQMLRESHASGSINPNDIRTTDGPEPFGATAAKAVLGSWWRNPNAAVLSVEIEGFAKDGPNAKQRDALKRLVADLRTRHPNIGLLGHRDFADYKACPGRFIPWAELGGHGPAQSQAEDPEMRPFPVGIDDKIVDIRTGAQLYNLDLTTTDAPTVSLGNDKPSHYTYRTGDVNYRVVEVSTGGVPHLWLVKVSDCSSITAPVSGSPGPSPATVLNPGLYEVPGA